MHKRLSQVHSVICWVNISLLIEELVMKKLVGVLFVIVIAAAKLTFAQNNDQIPKGWYKAGNNPSGYEMGIDSSTFQSGHSSAYIKAINSQANQFGTLLQTINAENYLGKRLRLSSYIKSQDVAGFGAMWMRVDGENNKQLELDNMYNREIKGNTDWTKYDIVLDVPSNSKSITFGVLLSGTGEVWFDNFKLDKVDNSVPLTITTKENKFPDKPINLDFEK